MPTKTRTKAKSRTKARAKTKVILASTFIVAAAAAGAYQVDRASYTQENVPAAELVAYGAEATVDFQGYRGAESAEISFEMPETVTERTTINFILPPDVEASATSTLRLYVDGRLYDIGSNYASGRSLTVIAPQVDDLVQEAKMVLTIDNLVNNTGGPLVDTVLPVEILSTLAVADAEDDAQEAADGSVASDGSVVADGSTEQGIEVVTPNGGEIVSSDDLYTIVWTEYADGATYAIDWSQDGTAWQPLGQTDTNSYDADFNGAVADSAYIRVSVVSADGSALTSDMSDDAFVLASGEQEAADQEEAAQNAQVDDGSNQVVDDSSNQVADDGSNQPVDDGSNTSDGNGSVVVPSDDGSSVSNGGSSGSGGSGSYTPAPEVPSTAGFNNLIKMECPAQARLDVNHPCRTVYFHSALGTRHAFPGEKVFFSWYNGFDDVNIISKSAMADIPLGDNVTYRPGSIMVKFQSLNTVYMVDRGGVLRAVDSEAVAAAYYGSAWNKYIHDISDVFYRDYSFGVPIVFANEFSPEAASLSVSSISENL